MCQSCGFPGDDHFVLSVAYPANRLDGHGEWASAETVMKSAHGFMRTGQQIGFDHADGTVGHATVLESYLHRGADLPFDNYVIKSGDWVIGVEFDAATWPEVRSGRVNGFSIQGVGKRRKPHAPEGK